MDTGLESDLRRQIADLETKISEYEGLLYHHEHGWNSLKQSKAFLAAIVDSFDGLIYVVSRDLKIQYLNRALLEKVGRNALGKPCYEVLHHRAAVCPFCVHEQVFNGEAVHSPCGSIHLPAGHGDGHPGP